MKNNSFSIIKRITSFSYAINGIKILYKEEHNIRIHLLAAIIAIGLGFIFEISTMEWIAISFSIGLVIILETINSAIENLCDFISPDKHELIKKVKDLSAAAVLFGAITAAVIGSIVFIPKII